MTAFDTNLLIYAASPGSQFHSTARRLLEDAAEGAQVWALPWPCLYEFLRVTTHPKVFYPPMPLPVALVALQSLLASPSLQLLAESPRHADVLAGVLRETPVTGNLIHDAHIWALCLEHGVSTFVSGDHDFLRFRGIRVSNPFEAS